MLKAIIHFDEQNYPNKELIISVPKRDIISKNLIETVTRLSDLNIIQIERENDISLGNARNEAIYKCSGEYICTWDDDDWFREVRLMYQYTSLGTVKQKREACIITRIVLYDGIKNQAYYSGKYNFSPYNWAGTLLCKKEIIKNHPYSNKNIAEDTNLIQYLTSSKYLYRLENYNLYTFVYHGANSLNKYQFNYFIRNMRRLSGELEGWMNNQINKTIELIPY
ncbi:glycosyltransferase family A protein [Pedobacter sp. AW31-3R]|uniref:glycosyltransferase family A protein n=1 Tax=Pedobacter sp. AW31-3R TaxID=3445781 RepID=UPI003FA0CF12